MDELRIVGAGRMREIVLFGQRDGQPPERRVAGDARTRGSAANDMDVEFFVGKTFEVAVHVSGAWGEGGKLDRERSGIQASFASIVLRKPLVRKRRSASRARADGGAS